MNGGFDAIDALLDGARQEVPLPPAEERRTLREELNLSRAEVARALGVSPSTLKGWETGRDPSGELRQKYAYFLDGARTRLTPPEERQPEPEQQPETETEPEPGTEAGPGTLAETEPPAPPADTAAPPADTAVPAADLYDEDVAALTTPQPCVLCGRPAHHQVAGFAQHLDPAECGAVTPETPVGEAPLGEAPVGEKPVREAPVREQPVREAPAPDRRPARPKTTARPETTAPPPPPP
uniref:helix-turn-helix domain-containing protein n=1 Tax=Streptomyces corallincola TaxID=2851888 RepID=UPI001FECF26D